MPLCFCAGIERMVHDHARSILRYYVCPAHVLSGGADRRHRLPMRQWRLACATGPWCSARRPLSLLQSPMIGPDGGTPLLSSYDSI